MRLRVSCRACRLFPAWTDDPDGPPGTVCNRPFRCDARLNDEQATDVTGHYMEGRHRVFCSLVAEEDSGDEAAGHHSNVVAGKLHNLRRGQSRKGDGGQPWRV